MIGARVVLDPGASVLPSLCVIPGSAYAVPVAAFAKVVEASAKFRQLVYRYTSIFAFDLAQHSVCNRFHGPVQRLARWLLLDFDRSEGPTIQITHESLAQLLGVQRPAVSLAAAQLQKSGAIAYKRGRITLKSRMRLEAQACECYRAIAAEWRRLH
jgi:CRP-like cAMP-binding protein